MASTTSTSDSTATHSGANPLSMIFHIRKTVGLTNAVLRDPRVHWLPKFAFVGSIGALLLALLFPELAVDAFAFLPTAGLFEFIGLPADVSIDWVAFSVAAFNLLKLFPAEVVGEHYDRLFRGR